MKSYALTREGVPTFPHWVILEFSIKMFPGDEASKNHGQGRQEHAVSVIQYRIYRTKKEWLMAILKRERAADKNYVAMFVRPVVELFPFWFCRFFQKKTKRRRGKV